MMRIITHNFKTLLTAVVTILTYSTMSSQERSCGMEAYMQQQMQNPEFARQHEENQMRFREELERIGQNPDALNRRNPVVIPVAVHFPTGNESNRACLEALAQNQVDILNADYTATNSDISLWNTASAFYPGVNVGAINYFFCLATTNHPSNTDAQMVEGGPAVTIGWPFGGAGQDNYDSRWAGYMNFVIRNINDLGFSPLGGSIANGYAVTMDNNAFGSGSGCPGFVPSAPYNLGRTVTHELGHFYNLAHTFGYTAMCGTDDDGIADTPQVATATYNCPSNGSVNGCVSGEKALTMNYMDYTNDACMYMFTAGQATVMEAYLSFLQSQFKPNVTECAFDPNFQISAFHESTSACPAGGSVSYTFDFTTFEGFNENTVFSASGQPSGTTVSFSPSSMSANGQFVMTVSNLGGATLGDYTITVTGTSTSVTNSEIVELTLGTGPCPSFGHTNWNTSTTGVTFNTINNLNSGKSPSGYGDYTAQVTTVNRNSSYPLSVRVNTDGNYPIETRVWIDWNQNCSFNDPGEEYNLGYAANVSNGLTGGSPLSITVPVSAVLGNTTMRVATKYVNTDDSGLPKSCLTSYDGETEDYTLNVDVQLGVAEFGAGDFSIYPNPNNGRFNISLNSSSNENVKVTVYDIRGRKVYENAFENTSNFNEEVSLNSIQSGMYLVKVSDGHRQATKKIVVE